MSWPIRLAIGLPTAAALMAFSVGLGSGRSGGWQRWASPGSLSDSHAFLERDCAACQSRRRAADPSKCIACHATSEALLGRTPTAFHAAIKECRACHLEHRGRGRRPSDMDHDALAAIGLREFVRSGRPGKGDRLVAQTRETASENTLLTARERLLACAACHGTKDRHFKFFGPDCAQCHATSTWTIAAFRHPPPSSTECAQCHQAPPSHYMEHFQMVSMTTARKADAQVRQCFLCHQTTAWNDIRGVGWYKHH